MGQILPISLASQWSRSRQLLQLGGASERADVDRACNLEDAVLHGEIRSMADAVAKLKAIELSFTEGERTDGADAEALRQTIRWLASKV